MSLQDPTKIYDREGYAQALNNWMAAADLANAYSQWGDNVAGKAQTQLVNALNARQGIPHAAKLSRFAGNPALLKALSIGTKAVPVIGTIAGAGAVADLATGNERWENKAMDTAAGVAGGWAGAAKGAAIGAGIGSVVPVVGTAAGGIIGGAIGGLSGFGLGKSGSDLIQYLGGGGKSPEEQQRELLLAQLRQQQGGMV